MSGNRKPVGARRTVALATVAVVAAVAAVAVGVDLYGDSSAAGAAPTRSHASDAQTKAMDAMAMTTTNGMAGMPMPMPVPMQTLGSADWQGMRIVARASTPLPFVVFSGTTERTVKPSPKDSMHLMVMLSDEHGGMAIPYASVWATIRKDGRVVYDERQWPMLSRYMGPHYGNDVALPGKGTYQLTLLISPPQAARHMEYAKLWLKPHRVTMTFTWKGKG
jgi:hypothetical protein